MPVMSFAPPPSCLPLTTCSRLPMKPIALPCRELGIDGRISHVLLATSYASSARNAAESCRFCSSPPPT